MGKAFIMIFGSGPEQLHEWGERGGLTDGCYYGEERWTWSKSVRFTGWSTLLPRPRPQVVTKRMRSWIQVVEMSFFSWVTRFFLRDELKSSVIEKGLRLELLLLHIDKGASWGGPGISYWEEARGQTQDTYPDVPPENGTTGHLCLNCRRPRCRRG